MSNTNILWTEKYRPKKPNKLLSQNKVKNYIISAIKDKNIMNLLLYGPPGTGKTSVAKILVKNFFTYTEKDFPNMSKELRYMENIELYKERVLMLNASDDRGIQIVREKIKKFASFEINNSEINKNIPPIKLIILDEVDHMAQDAQFALRRIIEDYSEYTRFILICNYISKIIEPLISRCGCFNFMPINIDDMKQTINKIFIKEGYNHLNLSDDIYNYIYTNVKGDMRRIIILFQRLCSITDMYNINIEHIRNILGEFPDDILIDIINIINKPLTNKNINQLNKIIVNIINNGYNIINLIDHLFSYYLYTNDINEDIKMKIFIKLSQTDNRFNQNCSEKIQLLQLFIYMSCVYNNIEINETYNPYTINIIK